MSHKILAVEDDQDVLGKPAGHSGIGRLLRDRRQHAQGSVSQPPWSEFSVLLLDGQFPDGLRDTILPESHESAAHPENIVIPGYSDLYGKIAAIRSGATDYLVKAINPDQLRGAIARALTIQEMEERTCQAEGLAAIGDLLQTAPDAMLRIDTDGRIHLLNAEAKRMFGYRAEILLG